MRLKFSTFLTSLIATIFCSSQVLSTQHTGIADFACLGSIIRKSNSRNRKSTFYDCSL